MKRLITICLLSGIMLSCHAQDCSKLPESFSSYMQALNLVKKSNFKIKESANVSSSSWLRSVKFYSCDGTKGYLIYTTNKNREYIHFGVPTYIWEGLKNASSKGSFYDVNIKNKYQVKLN